MKTIAKILTVSAVMLVGQWAEAQTLLLDFQAATYTTGDLVWTDSASGVTATVSGNPLGEGGHIDTTGGAFAFNLFDATGLPGLTSYTIAVGFSTASFGVKGGAAFYDGTYGVAGGDIGGFGKGDVGFGLTTDAGGQLVAGLGVEGKDSNVYATHNRDHLSLDTPVGAVLVVDGTAGRIDLYFNGVRTEYRETLVMRPLGADSGGVIYNFGIGKLASGGGTLQGYITQFQIYDDALSVSDARALSLTISAASIPEPGVWALLTAGGFILAGMGWGKRKSK